MGVTGVTDGCSGGSRSGGTKPVLPRPGSAEQRVRAELRGADAGSAALGSAAQPPASGLGLWVGEGSRGMLRGFSAPSRAGKTCRWGERLLS